jgi:hypothetical protein
MWKRKGTPPLRSCQNCVLVATSTQARPVRPPKTDISVGHLRLPSPVQEPVTHRPWLCLSLHGTSPWPRCCYMLQKLVHPPWSTTHRGMHHVAPSSGLDQIKERLKTLANPAGEPFERLPTGGKYPPKRRPLEGTNSLYPGRYSKSTVIIAFSRHVSSDQWTEIRPKSLFFPPTPCNGCRKVLSFLQICAVSRSDANGMTRESPFFFPAVIFAPVAADSGR